MTREHVPAVAIAGVGKLHEVIEMLAHLDCDQAPGLVTLRRIVCLQREFPDALQHIVDRTQS